MKNRFYTGNVGDTCNGFNTVFMREVFNVAKRLLPPREYEIFYLHAVKGWTFAELGQKFSISSSRVRQLYVRSQEELIKHIDMNKFFHEKASEPSEPEQSCQTSEDVYDTYTAHDEEKVFDLEYDKAKRAYLVRDTSKLHSENYSSRFAQWEAHEEQKRLAKEKLWRLLASLGITVFYAIMACIMMFCPMEYLLDFMGWVGVMGIMAFGLVFVMDWR